MENVLGVNWLPKIPLNVTFHSVPKTKSVYKHIMYIYGVYNPYFLSLSIYITADLQNFTGQKSWNALLSVCAHYVLDTSVYKVMHPGNRDCFSFLW